MANEDVLRMRATIVGEPALAELRKIERGLREVGSRGGNGFKAANTEAQKLAQTMKTIGTETAQTVLPGLMSISSAAGPIGLVVAAVVAAAVGLKKMATALVETSVTARGIGVTISQLKAMQNVVEANGMSVQSFTSNLQNFADEAAQLQFKVGGLYQKLNELGKFELRDKLVGEKDPAKQFAIVLEDINAVAKEKGQAIGRTYAKMLNVDPQFVGLSPDALKEAQKNAGDVYDRALPAAKALHENWVKTEEAISQSAAGVAAMTAEMNKQADTANRLRERSNRPNMGVTGTSPTPGNLVPISPDELGPDGVVPPGYVLTPRALGGSVHRGRPYLVGERGPELFSPAGSGNIIPNNRLGGGGNPDELSRIMQKGVFDALVQFKSYVESGQKAGNDNAGGVMNASFGGSGGAAAGGGVGGGGGASSFGGGGYTNLTPGTGGAQGGQQQTYDPGTGKVIGDTTGGGVHGGSAGGSGGISAPAGTPIARSGLATVTAASGRKFQVDQRFAPNFQGFINDYEKAGGQLGPDTGTLGSRPHNASGHPIGAAIDINQIGRGVRSRGGRGTSLDPKVEDELAEKWGMVSGNKWRSNDQGHFGIRSVEAARQALIRNGVDPGQASAIAKAGAGGSEEGGKTVKGSVFATPDDPSEPAGRKTAGGFSNQMPGIALPRSYGKPTGKMYSVTMPDGRTFQLPHIDTGPHPRTGRGIDITGAAAAQMGYNSKTFPTDKPITYAPTSTDRIDGNSAAKSPTGNVDVTINSNGTKASASAKADGFFQEPRVQQHRQMRSTHEASEAMSI